MKLDRPLRSLSAVLSGAVAVLALSTPAPSQDAEPVDVTSSRDYGNSIVQIYPDYAGDEIPTADGRIIAYRQTDAYDEYESAKGANAIFVDMRSGTRRLVLPKGSDRQLFFLSVIYSYDRDEEEIGIGYVARVGTRADYDKGRLDMIVGRFSDLKQKQIFENVRFVDAPTYVEGSRISVVLWPEDTKARFIEIDLANFSVTKDESIDVPEPVASTPRPCSCDAETTDDGLIVVPVGNKS